jgi:hypothetical protein
MPLTCPVGLEPRKNVSALLGQVSHLTVGLAFAEGRPKPAMTGFRRLESWRGFDSDVVVVGGAGHVGLPLAIALECARFGCRDPLASGGRRFDGVRGDTRMRHLAQWVSWRLVSVRAPRPRLRVYRCRARGNLALHVRRCGVDGLGAVDSDHTAESPLGRTGGLLDAAANIKVRVGSSKMPVHAVTGMSFRRAFSTVRSTTGPATTTVSRAPEWPLSSRPHPTGPRSISSVAARPSSRCCAAQVLRALL